MSEPATSGDPRPGGTVLRLGRGACYLLQGWRFVVSTHPSLLKYCLLPFLISALVFGAVAVGLYYFYSDLVALIWAKPESWLLRGLWYLFYVFILALILLASYVLYFVVQAALAAPFNDLLSERVEELVYGREPPAFSWRRLLRGLGRTVGHELIKLLIYVSVILPLVVASVLIPVVGQALFLLGGGYLTALFLGYDFLDFCMARREWSFARKWQALKDHRALALGLGGGLAFVMLVPLLGLLSMPMAGVGGTLLFCDLERSGAFSLNVAAPVAPESTSGITDGQDG